MVVVTTSNPDYAARNNNGGQTGAAVERPRPDVGDAVGDGDAGEAGAARVLEFRICKLLSQILRGTFLLQEAKDLGFELMIASGQS